MRLKRLAIPVFIGVLLFSTVSFAYWGQWRVSDDQQMRMRLSSQQYVTKSDSFIHYIEIQNISNMRHEYKCTISNDEIGMRPDVWRFSLSPGQSNPTGGTYWIDSHNDTDYDISCEIK